MYTGIIIQKGIAEPIREVVFDTSIIAGAGGQNIWATKL